MRLGGRGDGTAWQAMRPDAGPTTIMPPDAMPVPAPRGALAGDMARLFRVLGLQSFRASVVDMASMAYESAWLVGEDGALVDEPGRAPLDSAFPGSASVMARLAHARLDETLDQPLGARRCIYAWRLDGGRVVIAEARYLERHHRARDLDIAAARLVCSAGLLSRGRGGPGEGADAGAGGVEGRAGAGDGGRVVGDAPALRWSQSPGAEGVAARGPLLAGLGLSAAAALLAGWLALAAAPGLGEQTQLVGQHSARLRSMADDTLAQALAAALASGDYGEVQHQLGGFERLGYFRGALVTNARQRVVASAGQVDDTLRIGIELPEGTVPKAPVRDLMQGAERLGRLVIVKPAGGEPLLPDLAPVRSVAGVAAGAAALAAALLAWVLRRRRVS